MAPCPVPPPIYRRKRKKVSRVKPTYFFLTLNSNIIVLQNNFYC